MTKSTGPYNELILEVAVDGVFGTIPDTEKVNLYKFYEYVNYKRRPQKEQQLQKK